MLTTSIVQETKPSFPHPTIHLCSSEMLRLRLILTKTFCCNFLCIQTFSTAEKETRRKMETDRCLFRSGTNFVHPSHSIPRVHHSSTELDAEVSWGRVYSHRFILSVKFKLPMTIKPVGSVILEVRCKKCSSAIFTKEKWLRNEYQMAGHFAVILKCTMLQKSIWLRVVFDRRLLNLPQERANQMYYASRD